MLNFEIGSIPLSFTPKRTNEVLTLAFDFNPVLGTGETIVSGSWYINVVRPAAASIAGMMVGTTTIMSGQSFQQFAGGTDGALYVVTAQIVTNNSNVIEENALLRVTDSPYI